MHRDHDPATPHTLDRTEQAGGALPNQPHTRKNPAHAKTISALIPTLILASIFTILTSCGTITMLRGTSGSFVSDEQPHRLNPDLRTRIFDSENSNTADLVLSDLPLDTLTDGDAWQDATGQIIHARMFVQPRPGRTPIETTACTVTIRYLVLAGDGEYGLYAGGGFLIPNGAPEGEKFSGEIYNASLRLVSVTPGFKDLIGAGRLDIDFSTRRNAEAVQRATRNADFLAFAALPVEDHPLLVNEE